MTTVRSAALALALALAVFSTSVAIAPAASAADSVLQVVAVKVNAGQLDAYKGKLAELNGILKRLGIEATMRAWQATVAGDNTGNVVVGLEYASLAAYADASTKIEGDAEWQKLVGSLDGMRTLLGTSLYREITP